jgi:hypothetical protein
MQARNNGFTAYTAGIVQFRAIGFAFDCKYLGRRSKKLNSGKRKSSPSAQVL